MKTMPVRLSANVLYVIALSHEAKPLYEKLQAKLFVSKYGFKLYHVDAKDVLNSAAVLVTGSGSNAMSSGLTWAQQYLTDVQAFLNVGIAGHGSLPRGSIFLVSKVTDQGSGKCFYPHPVVRKHKELQFSDLLTVSKPSGAYKTDCAYDMEASAFFETGRRFLNAEAVQSIKVVSDNTESNFSQLTPQLVVDFIEKNSDLIVSYAEQLLMSSTPNEIDIDVHLMSKIQTKWKVSVSNQTILQELLRSSAILAPHCDRCFPQPEDSETLKQYITVAKQWVLSVKPVLVCSDIDGKNGVRNG